MIVNKPVAQQVQVLNNTLAIPVGTGTVFAYSKFLWDKRDLNCSSCKNGMKSMIAKRINDKTYNIPVVCTCVPYTESTDVDGVSVVVYKGRRERWVKGKRPESYILDEAVRGNANKAAVNTKAMVSGQNVIQGKKYQFVKNTEVMTRVQKSEFLSKSVPGMSIKKAPEIPAEAMDLSKPPVFGDVTKDSLPPPTKGPQKSLHTLANGSRVFVDDKTFSRLSGQPMSKSVKSKAGSPTTTEQKRRGRPAKVNSAPVALSNEDAALARAVGTKTAPVVVPTEPISTEKKRRGRPKKVVVI